MSISSEIERIKTNIENAYAQLESKGATLPTERNSDNLSSVVITVPTGGGSLDEYLITENNQIYGQTSSYYAGINKIFKKIDKSIIGTGPFDNFAYAFAYLTNLEEIDYTGIDIEGLTSFAYGFATCYNLKKHDLKNRTFPNLTTINYIHYGNSKLTEIDLTNTSMPNLTSVSYAFYYCSLLQDLAEIDASKVMSVNNSLSGCSSLKTFGGYKNLGKGYPTYNNANYSSHKLDISTCTALSHDSLMNIINKLYDLNLTYKVASGGTLKTQQLILGSTNLAKLTSDEIAIATNKGWTVS